MKVCKTRTLNATHYFIIKMTSKREPQQITSNHLSDTDFKDFMKSLTIEEEPLIKLLLMRKPK